MNFFKKSGYIVLGILMASCVTKPKYDPSDNPKGKSILDIEYINDTLGVNLVDFRVETMSKNEYELSLYAFSKQSKLQLESHKFFVHAYPEKKREKPGNFISLDTDEFINQNDTLIFSRKFYSETESFEMIRYGLVDPKNRIRLFTLTLDNVSFISNQAQ